MVLKWAGDVKLADAGDAGVNSAMRAAGIIMVET
jgi:hypothetical protein